VALLAKGGNRLFWLFWPIWWQSPESTVLAGSELKLGIDLFAGKSEITEGCSDLREIGDSSDLPGISDVRLSTCGAAVRLVLRTAGAAIGGSGVWLASVPLLERAPC
jgi:hypothetical protein